MASLTKYYDPFRGIFGFPRWTDELEDPVTQKGLKIHETDKNVIVEAVVAGVPSKDVTVEIDDGVLVIKAETNKEDKQKGEYKYSSYQYYYTLALSGGQWSKTDANVKHGIVTVTIPKEEAKKPHKVSVKAEEE